VASAQPAPNVSTPGCRSLALPWTLTSVWRRWLTVATVIVLVGLVWWVVSVGRLSGEQRNAASTFGQFVVSTVGPLGLLVPAVVWLWLRAARSTDSVKSELAQRKHYKARRELLIIVIVAAVFGAVALFSDPEVPNATPGEVLAAIVAVAVLLGLIVTTLIPRRFTLVINGDELRLDASGIGDLVLVRLALSASGRFGVRATYRCRASPGPVRAPRQPSQVTPGEVGGQLTTWLGTRAG